VNVGLGASGTAVAGTTAIVANMSAGSISIINLTGYTVSSVALPAGSRPYQVAISAQGDKAVITAPMSNGFLILDLGTKAFTEVGTSIWNAMGPGNVVINGNSVYIANQMTPVLRWPISSPSPLSKRSRSTQVPWRLRSTQRRTNCLFLRKEQALSTWSI
jgi:DNA-binding beta-propeller fold protein YncE